MAQKKPRLRKAPTVRELVEAKAEPAQAKKPKHLGWGVVGPLKVLLTPLLVVLRFIGRVLNWLLPRYFINAWREVRQVTWPSRRETWRLTTAVFVFAIVFGSLVYVVDKGIDVIFKRLILQ